MTKVNNSSKKAVDVRFRTVKEANVEINKMRKYNSYLNMQVDRLWDCYTNLCDEVATLKATPKSGC